MTDSTEQIALVFNGEIYNFRELRAELIARGHRFRSSSDTEVILNSYREWGVECVSRFTGMFAIALFDARHKKLFLARDRAGEKPLFYIRARGAIRFASEIKALLQDPGVEKRLSPEGLDLYLGMGFVPFDRCILHGINKLPAAHALEMDLEQGIHKVWQYWDLPEFDGSFSSSATQDAALVDEFEALLEDAVRRQLVADVPIGVLLSGGTDSSLVTAMAARSASNVKTFTIAFPGHGSYDEGPFARKVATHFGTEHTELVAEPATVELLPELARQYDEPLGDSSMIPTFLVSRLVRTRCTVALGGDAGDELFGGYVYYSRILHQLGWRKFVPRPLKMLVGAGATLLPAGTRGKTYLRSLSKPDSESWIPATIHFDFATRRRLAPITRELKEDLPESIRRAASSDRMTLVQKMTAADFRTYLPDDILVKVDRASMLASLEVRAPFLDTSLIEFAFRKVPDRMRATHSERKVILKRLGQRVLPADLDLGRKQGFSIPLHEWFKGDWGQHLRDVLLNAPKSLYDPRTVRALLRSQQLGMPNAQRIFNLAFFELWRREYGIEVS